MTEMNEELDTNEDLFFKIVLADIHKESQEPHAEVLMCNVPEWYLALVKIVKDVDAALTGMRAAEDMAKAVSSAAGSGGVSPYLAAKGVIDANRKTKRSFKSKADLRLSEVKAIVREKNAKESSLPFARLHSEIARQGVLLRAIAEKMGISMPDTEEEMK